MSDRMSEEAIRVEIEIMEKEIVYLKGRRRARAKRAYYRLLHSCGETCGLDKPIYLKRCE